MTERSPDEDRAFAELRQLIVGPEQDTLAELRERVEDRQRRVEDVGDVLPEAAARCADDAALSKALAPAVEDALIASVRANPNTLADVLFPVMGPAIRKSLAQFLADDARGHESHARAEFFVSGPDVAVGSGPHRQELRGSGAAPHARLPHRTGVSDSSHDRAAAPARGGA